MALFLPPGNLDDLKEPGQLEAWSKVVEGHLVRAIGTLERNTGVSQLVSPLSGADDFRLRLIPWLTPPQTTYDHEELADARRITDDPNDSRSTQDEYSEWYTHRDAEGRVTSVDLTTELPEYWTSLAELMPRDQFLALYRSVGNSLAEEADIFPGGIYRENNRWNSADGIVHMIQTINNLEAAVGLIRDAIVWTLASDDEHDLDAVIDCQDCTRFLSRHHADPTVIAHFNRLAREGRFITLENPIGVYIVGIDTDGWVTPDGSDPRKLVRYTRGNPPVRARIAEPDGRFPLSEVTIGGEPILSGSQIAERTTVGVRALVGPPGQVRPTRGRTCRKRGAAPPPPAADALTIVEETVTIILGRTR